jgi:hypothetical protein
MTKDLTITSFLLAHACMNVPHNNKLCEREEEDLRSREDVVAVMGFGIEM